MSESSAHFSHGQIDQLLEDRLSEQEQAALESHLEHCESCRRALEQQAAASEDWDAAREILSTDDTLDHRSQGGEHVSESIEGVLARLQPTDDPHMLGRLGAYEIAGVVGAGGMGVVLKGFDRALDRFVAIKVLAPHLAVSAAARRRFAREAKAAAAVVHENVVAIHAVAEAHDPPYFVMPYVRGVSLEKRLRDQGPLQLEEVLRIGRQIAAGLAAAHAQGLVHRDIKPANILLADGTERLQITDFGLARAADDASLTRTGVIAGTPQYMSPEQARGEAVDMRSDQFSLGSVMYTMCTGHPPFRAETSYGVMQRINEDKPRAIRENNVSIPTWLERLILRLLAKEPSRRFDSAQQIADVLQQCLAHVQQPALSPLPVECGVAHRPRWRLAAAAIIVLVFLSGGYMAFNEHEAASPLTDTTSAAPESTTTETSWSDATDREIQQIVRDVAELEHSAASLWEPEVPTVNEAPQSTVPSQEKAP